MKCFSFYLSTSPVATLDVALQYCCRYNVGSNDMAIPFQLLLFDCGVEVFFCDMVHVFSSGVSKSHRTYRRGYLRGGYTEVTMLRAYIQCYKFTYDDTRLQAYVRSYELSYEGR